MRLNKDLVNQRMNEEGRTIKWLAAKTGLEYRTMCNVLRGAQNPSLPVIKLMSIFLQLPEDALVVDGKEQDQTKAI